MNNEAYVSKLRIPESTSDIIQNLLGCHLEDVIHGMDYDSKSLTTFLATIPNLSIENYLSPQWILLAAGKGTRIDPNGHFSKTLDIMFGEQNMLQLSRRYLPGKHPHIIVINPQMKDRISDSNSQEHLLGPHAITCVQKKMNGTGGALQAALPMIQKSEAEWIGVSFGDEPFLEKTIFAQTWLSHFLTEADVTLCGKIPETVVDKGGLFFDSNGKFSHTKEWYDMDESEMEEMQLRLTRGDAYTNTGITIIRRSVLMDRIYRLQPHTNRNDELHHVDLVRLCYDDGLKTNAFIYRGEVLSGVNRWSNVLQGETAISAKNRDILVNKGVRVDPAAQITLECDNIEIGSACYLKGTVQIGRDVKIGDYCKLEDVKLTGNTSIGNSVTLQNVTAENTTIGSNKLPLNFSDPLNGLATASTISNSSFDSVAIGPTVELTNIHAHATVIPSNIRLKNQTLGVPYTKVPYGVKSSLFKQIVPSDYRPGVFTFGEKKELPDWNNLREHVISHSASELIPRATRNDWLQKETCDAIKTLLDMRLPNGDYLIEGFTPEELWGTIFEMVNVYTGNPNPYHQEKLQARETALELLPEFWTENWLDRLKLVAAGNVIDYSSARVVQKVNSNPHYFLQALRAAVETDFAIDCYGQFNERVIDATPQQIIWLVDNDGEVVFDIAFIMELIECGHKITMVGKADNASNDVTLADLHDLSEYSQFKSLQQGIRDGDVRFISSGAKTIGTNLYNATPEFINALLDADLVISKGQGNFFTTPGWNMDTFYLLLSKGLTAERSTGVVADKNLPIDGMILAYLPAGTKRDATLSDLCNL